MIGSWYCYSTLAPLNKCGFSTRALSLLADGHAIPFEFNYTLEELNARYAADSLLPLVALPGFQPKLGLSLYEGRLRFAEAKSKYILKWQPPEAGEFATDWAANEHLTMQIAAQVFKIVTAPNACLELLDGEHAYLTRRFDYQGRQRIHVEDFCQLSGRSPATHGVNYKVKCSYEEAAAMFKRHCATYRMEALRFFKRVLFNLFVGNHHAHLKNLSVMRSFSGDIVLAPAYDLHCSALHFPDQPCLAMPLFKEEEAPAQFYQRDDLIAFGLRIGLEKYQIAEELRRLDLATAKLEPLVRHSFLSPNAKKRYLQLLSQHKRAILR